MKQEHQDKLNAIETVALQLINGYRNFIQFIEDNNFDHSDFYNNDIELIIKLKELNCLQPLDKIKEDLMELCEDNEVMKEEIKTYFDSF